jgi:hypothetical protein
MAANRSYGPRPWTFYVLPTLFALFVVFLYGPMIAVLVLSFQGPSASRVFPLRNPSLMWFDELFNPRRFRRRGRRFLPFAAPGADGHGADGPHLGVRGGCLPPALPWLVADLLHRTLEPDRAGPGAVDRHARHLPLSCRRLGTPRRSARTCPRRCLSAS